MNSAIKMSEPISAFAAYHSATSKSGNTSKKGNNKKGAGTSNKTGANKNNAAKNKSLQKNKPEKAIKGRNEAKSNIAAKEKVTHAKAKEVVEKNKVDKTSPKTEPSKNKATTKKVAGKSEPPAKQKEKRQHAAANGIAATNGIEESEIDNLVEQLLADSPSKPKKLTKAQQKKKQELEDYLVKELEKDDVEACEEEYDSEIGSEEDYSGDSDEFSDEYTINSYTDEEEEEGDEEEDSLNGDYSSETDVVKQHIATTTKNIVPQKRKGNAESSSKAASEATEQKKARQTEKPADKRKSIPATIATTADKAAKPAEKRRYSISEKASEAASTSKVIVKTVDARAVKMEPLSPPINVVKMNSIQEGEKVFSWLLSPLNLKEFFSKYWETGACLVKRKGSKYYSTLMSFEAIDQMLINNHVEFTKNIDITSYKNGVRETLNPVGRAVPPIVWDHYGQGCSVRLLNPHTYLPELFKLNTTLQEYFHCLVGANAYLTPPNSQGFAPHYDDIEAFVLQIEGRKRWRLYNTRAQAEQLPRYSSKNFTQQEIGQPIFDEVCVCI